MRCEVDTVCRRSRIFYYSLTRATLYSFSWIKPKILVGKELQPCRVKDIWLSIWRWFFILPYLSFWILKQSSLVRACLVEGKSRRWERGLVENYFGTQSCLSGEKNGGMSSKNPPIFIFGEISKGIHNKPQFLSLERLARESIINTIGEICYPSFRFSPARLYSSLSFPFSFPPTKNNLIQKLQIEMDICDSCYYCDQFWRFHNDR